MSRGVIIIGTGGLAKECAQLIRQVDKNRNIWSEISYVTNNPAEIGGCILFGLIDKTDKDLNKIETETDVVVGIGSPQIRHQVYQRVSQNPHFRFPNLIHPSVEFDSAINAIGVGNIITKGVIITCGVTIGNCNLLNWNATIGHDAVIGNFNVLNPTCSISGHVSIGDECLIGTGARVLEKRSVHSGSIIGAGAVLTRSTVKAGVYVGIPARERPSQLE
jgi:sugar O-acyltransferase (sialic acid O-acetyltransferase NeuD family)